MLIYKNLSLIDIEDEIWKPVIGYEGLYDVSNFGRIKIVKRNKIKTQNITKFGYLTFTISKENRIKYVIAHRLVAQAFITNIEKKTQVNHINGIKHDNRVENLEWNTPSENQIHSFHVLNNHAPLINIKNTYQYTTKLKEKDIKYILQNRSIGVSAIELAKQFNVSCGSINRAIKLNKNKFGIIIPDNLPRVSHRTKEEVHLASIKSGMKKAKAILLYDINNNFIKRFDSKRELSREYGLNRGCISRCLRGISDNHKGFIFKNEN